MTKPWSMPRDPLILAPGSADVAEPASFILHLQEMKGGNDRKSYGAFVRKPPALSRRSRQRYRLSGRIEEAVAAFKAYNARQPGFGLTDLVIAYQDNDQGDEAKQTAQRLLVARRDFTITSWLKTQFRRDTARLDADIAALRMAGLPMG